MLYQCKETPEEIQQEWGQPEHQCERYICLSTSQWSTSHCSKLRVSLSFSVEILRPNTFSSGHPQTLLYPGMIQSKQPGDTENLSLTPGSIALTPSGKKSLIGQCWI